MKGDREAILKEAREYAFGDYGVALLKGSAITKEEKEAAAAKLSKLTGNPGGNMDAEEPADRSI